MYTIAVSIIPHYQKGKAVVRLIAHNMHPSVPRVNYDLTVNIPSSGKLSPAAIKKGALEAANGIAENYTYMLRDYYDRRDLPRALSGEDWYWNKRGLGNLEDDGELEPAPLEVNFRRTEPTPRLSKVRAPQYNRIYNSINIMQGSLSTSPTHAPPPPATFEAFYGNTAQSVIVDEINAAEEPERDPE